MSADIIARGLAARNQTLAGFTSSQLSKQLNVLDRLRSAAIAAANNNAEDLPIMAAPPVVSASATATGALSRTYPYAANAALYRVSGGIPVENNTAAGFFVFPVIKVGNGTVGSGNLGTWTGDAEDQQCACSVTFQTDADIVEFLLRKNTTAGRNYRFIVDGQYIDKAGSDVSAISGTSVYIKLDFSALTPARKMRVITVEGAGSNQHMFNRVAVGPTASIAYPGSTRTDIVALFGGDSFTEGENLPGGNKHLCWTSRACKRLGIHRLYNLGIGTTGYVNNGSSNRRRLVDQVTNDWGRSAFAQADLIAIANGYNDKAASAANSTIRANIQTQALASWQAIRTRFPNALIVVLGVFGGKTGPDADTLATENALKAQFDAWADSFSMWIPVSTDPSPWQFGTGNVSAPNGSGNSDLTTSNDNVHPSDYGQDLLSYRFAQAFRDGLARR